MLQKSNAIKKVLSMITFLLFDYFLLFGQSEEYFVHKAMEYEAEQHIYKAIGYEVQQHIDKAKEYESQKKWCYALGEYYDALKIEKNNNVQQAYKQLSEVIKNGNPGYGSFDVFTLVDDWVLLMQDFEAYWTEYCPIMFVIGIPQRTEINRENRTVTYEADVSFELSDKYKEIEQILQEGLKKSYSDDWQMDYLNFWPEVSVYNGPKDKDKFLQNGAALTQNLLKDKYKEYVYSRYKLLASTALFGCMEQGFFVGEYFPNHKTTMFDLKVALIDKEENILFESKRLLVGPEAKFTFTLDQNSMKYIDDGEYFFIPKALYLQYGNIPVEPWITKNSRDWIKTLPEKEFSIDNVILVQIDKATNEKFSYTEKKRQRLLEEERKKQEEEWQRKLEEARKKIEEEEKQRQIEEERRKQEKEEERRKAEEEKKAKQAKNRNINYSYSKLMKNEYIVGKYIVKYISNKDYYDIKDCYNEVDPSLQQEYGTDKYSLVMMYILCNAISYFEQLELVYSIPNYVNTYGGSIDYDEKLSFYLTHFDNITVDLNADGYRMMSDEEWKKISKKLSSVSNDPKNFIIRDKR